MKLVIEGKPIPQKRHRTVRRGILSINYDPCSKDKENSKKQIYSQMSGVFFANLGPLFDAGSDLICNITFHMPIPKSWPKKKLMRFEEIPHNIKPDCDNLAKFAMDCLTGILYKDDCEITDLHVKKVYSLNPRTEIEIYQKDKL